MHHNELADLRASEIGGLAKAEVPPDALVPFADVAVNRPEQDLLMFSNGIRTRAFQRRCSHAPRSRSTGTKCRYCARVLRAIDVPAL